MRHNLVLCFHLLALALVLFYVRAFPEVFVVKWPVAGIALTILAMAIIRASTGRHSQKEEREVAFHMS